LPEILHDRPAAPPDPAAKAILAAIGRSRAGYVRFTARDGGYQATADAAALLGIDKRDGGGAQLASLLTAIAPPAGATVVRNAEDRLIRLQVLQRDAAETLLLVEDVTELVEREQDLEARQRQYRSLFENATYGIYRSSFEGRQLHANPALVRLNGYDSEAEMLAAVHDIAREWYVKPGRREEFIDELYSKGRVVDFVSEIYRHKTRERIWISETAWLVYDETGAPKYVEGTLVEATERMRNLERIKAAAETDALTGLPNRPAFMADVERRIAEDQHRPFTVLLIDLDRFKDINDVYGHARGDEVLRVIGARIREALPEGARLARLGGDEFAVLAGTTATDDAAMAAAERVVRVFEDTIVVDGSEHLLGVSIGMARYPQHARDASGLLRNADLALYNVKDRGRGHACMFDAALDLAKQKRHAIETDLRGADRRGELELFYQPIIEARSSAIVGLEALMRWRHPQRGLVPPADFIAIAEDAGFMTAFGTWAIREACRHAASLPGHIRVAVNVSALQFRSADLPRVVAKALADHQLAAARLELEVTEGVVLRNETVTLQVLEQLKQLGVRIALDDFGTGYSSLSYLQRFAFDKVKIDRSFVRSIMSDPVNWAVVRAVLSIGRDLGLAVVAEGIETDVERLTLLKEGCELFQGFLYGRPQPFTDMASRIALEQLQGPRQPVARPAAEKVARPRAS
jgi:diguanylate cyclase (GGDEF)-like protein/PAS domain S-box-containing protein